MPEARAAARIWILAVVAAVALVVTTTAAAVMTLDGRDHDAMAGHLSSGRYDPDDAGRGIPWGWMHGGRLGDEADYLARMVAHHREAVAAAEQLQRSDRPQMRAFGAAIVEVQTAQIDRMTAWLDAWYPDRSGDTDYRPMMRDLDGLSGDALDRAFLRDMTIHHMAAVMMSQQLLARGLAEHPEVASLARTIRDQQHREIVRMQRWLHSWYGERWHGGYGWMMQGGPRWMMGGRELDRGPGMMR